MQLNPQQLVSLERPAQYLGGEKNSVMKSDEQVDVHLALAFPDTYEVGMSHVGIQILYDLANRDERTWAERVYMPLPDMEQWLKDTGNRLFSVEAQRPLADFDLVGFSLQYELCGTNILAMLEMGGIPLRAKDRTDEHPIVIGGGPFAYHPEALAPFFDVFFLGDAEEFIPELLEAARVLKSQNVDSFRLRLLEQLKASPGIYIPTEYTPIYGETGTLQQVAIAPGAPAQIVRRLLPSLADAPFPKSPIVPNTKTVHNRLSLEVMRGCVRGCRFCQAGYLYRPQRERSPQEVLSLIDEILPNTGYEEVSLLSLSTADYCSIVPLLKSLMDRYGDGDKLAISFPSTRVDALTPEVLEQVQRVRRTGFTIAPEGGSQRLRDVINKGVTDEQIIETCSNVFSMGWTGIKLYFMIGLPTETDADLEAIIELAERIKSLPGARAKEITVSASTHVPKPHTPFQWAEQITPTETIRRQRLLAKGLSRIGVNFRYHDAFSSFLEGVFCRAGREIAEVLEHAYRLGARLDAWQEHLSEEIWTQAFRECNVNPYFYLRERQIEETLPWDHLSCGITKEYFAKEYRRALRDKTTADCLTQSCSICGACNYDTHRNVLWPRTDTEEQFARSVQAESNVVDPQRQFRYRLQYSKSGVFQFLGHLELVNLIHRTTRRAALPVCYTQGFHPLPKTAFGPPLQLGIASNSEYFDLYLYEEITIDDLCQRINNEFPEGLTVIEAALISRDAPSLSESVAAHHYEITFLKPPTGVFDLMQDSSATVENFLDLKLSREVTQKKRGRKIRRMQEFALSEFVDEVALHEDGFSFALKMLPQRAAPRPIEIVTASSGLGLSEVLIRKTRTEFQSVSSR
jgi:radical SAM family uncharacterized protein/radical SAM-linked protein